MDLERRDHVRRLLIVFSFVLMLTFGARAESDLYVESWSCRLGGAGKDILVDFDARSSGGLCLVGSADSVADNALGGTDAWVFTLDEDGEPLWSRRMGGKGEDRFTRVVALSDGGLVALGTTTSEDGDLEDNRHGRAGMDAWVVRLDSRGELVWQKCLGGPQDDELFDLHVSTNAVYLAGRSQSYKIDLSSNKGGYDAWACAISLETGASLWHYGYGSPGDDQFEHVLPDDDGWMFLGVQAVLEDSDSETWVSKPILAALDASGSEYGTYPVSGIDSIEIANTSRVDEGWILAGQTSISVGEAWIGQLSGDGSLVWQSWFSGNAGSRAIALYPFSDLYIMLGVTSSVGDAVPGTHGGQDIWVVARSETTPVVWQQALGGSKDSWPVGLTRMSDGSYLVVGVTASRDGDLSAHDAKRAGWLVQLGANGNLLWNKLLAPAKDQILLDMLADHDETLYLLGTVYGATEDQANAWVLKMTPSS